MSKAKAERGTTTAVRRFVRDHYVRPAKRGGQANFRVTVGDVHRALALHNRVPLVCNALVSRKFLEENGLRLVKRVGPPSGQSTTVAFTYEFVDERPIALFDRLRSLRGAGATVFAELGGGEGYLEKEREEFNRQMGERERTR